MTWNRITVALSLSKGVPPDRATPFDIDPPGDRATVKANVIKL
jgi:hypothetical protein